MSGGMMSTGGPLAWKDLTAEDKVERMRGIIRRQSQEINNLRNILRKLEALLQLHGHDTKDGNPTIPMKKALEIDPEEVKGYGESPPMAPLNPWFQPVDDDCFF